MDEFLGKGVLYVVANGVKDVRKYLLEVKQVGWECEHTISGPGLKRLIIDAVVIEEEYTDTHSRPPLGSPSENLLLG